jgi:transposase
VAVVELSPSSLAGGGGLVLGLKRQPLKKQTADPERLLDLLHRWRDEAVGAGHAINRIALTFEPGRDVCCWPKAAELSDATRSSAIWGTVLPT